jgi:heat shock protein HslJ
MNGIAPLSERYRITQKYSSRRNQSWVVTIILAQIVLAMTVAHAQTKLSEGLESPDSGVVCNLGRAICYDRFGPSVGLTESFLGHLAAQRLSKNLHNLGINNQQGTTFSPADSVECVIRTGPCRLHLQPQAALTEALYMPLPRPNGQTAEMRAILFGQWYWLRTRFNKDRETGPDHPEHYVLRFEPLGLLSAQADCNSAGGTYKLEDSRIIIKLTNSTLMSCQPDSLEQLFQQNLAAATTFFMKNGRLYLTLRNDSGAMEFDRPAEGTTLSR